MKYVILFLIISGLIKLPAVDFIYNPQNQTYHVPIIPIVIAEQVNSGLSIKPSDPSLVTPIINNVSTKVFTMNFNCNGIFGTSSSSYEQFSIDCQAIIKFVPQSEASLLWKGDSSSVTNFPGSAVMATWVAHQTGPPIVTAHWASASSAGSVSLSSSMNVLSFIQGYADWCVSSSIYPSKSSFEFWLSGANWAAPTGIPANTAANVNVNSGSSDGDNNGDGNVTNNTSNNTNIVNNAESITNNVTNNDNTSIDNSVTNNDNSSTDASSTTNNVTNNNGETTVIYNTTDPVEPTDQSAFVNGGGTVSTSSLQESAEQLASHIPVNPTGISESFTPINVFIPVPGTDGFNFDLSGSQLTGSAATAYDSVRLFVKGCIFLAFSYAFLIAATRLFKAQGS